MLDFHLESGRARPAPKYLADAVVDVTESTGNWKGTGSRQEEKKRKNKIKATARNEDNYFWAFIEDAFGEEE